MSPWAVYQLPTFCIPTADPLPDLHGLGLLIVCLLQGNKDTKMRAISWVAPADVGPVPTICSLTSPATTQTTLVLFCVSSEHTQASARNGLKVHVPAS